MGFTKNRKIIQIKQYPKKGFFKIRLRIIGEQTKVHSVFLNNMLIFTRSFLDVFWKKTLNVCPKLLNFWETGC